MTNYEHYKDWFEENKFLLFTRMDYAIDKDSKELCFCDEIDCDFCAFYKGASDAPADCNGARMEWLNAEYVEQKEEENDEL